MHSNLQCKRIDLPQGGMGLFTEQLAFWSWEDSPLLQRAFPYGFDFWVHSQRYHSNLPQVQYALADSSGEPVGGIVLTPTVDGQVGPCLVVVHSYLMPHVRGSLTLQRKLRKLALMECRTQSVRWLIITRQMPDGTQRITYKEVPNG